MCSLTPGASFYWPYVRRLRELGQRKELQDNDVKRMRELHRLYCTEAARCSAIYAEQGSNASKAKAVAADKRFAWIILVIACVDDHLRIMVHKM
jgi:hypothetical protein